MRRAPVAAVLCLAVVSSSAARAQDKTAQARTLFNAGAKAYEKGEYLAAAQAFQQAYKLASRPSLIFSTAQAYRRQYIVDKRPEHARIAADYYRRYLKAEPNGKRRSEAVAGLEMLQPALTVEPAADGSEPAPAPEVKAQTWIMITTPEAEAKMSVDGRPFGNLNQEVKPGPHQVVIRAPGYHDEARKLSPTDGQALALDIPLRPKSAQLTIQVESGASISVDGRFVGEAPLARPLDVKAGRHLLSITAPGRAGYSREIRVSRGQKQTVRVDLETTGQRTLSYVLLGGGFIGLAGGGVFSWLALDREGDAQGVLDAQGQGNIGRADQDNYDRARAARDDWRLAAGISFGVGGALGLTGLMLYLFDEPRAPAVTPIDDGADAPKPTKQPTDMEISAAPWFGPGQLGAGLSGRF